MIHRGTLPRDWQSVDPRQSGHRWYTTGTASRADHKVVDKPGGPYPRMGNALTPTSGLVVSLREVWKAVKDNRDLDLPAHKVMVATAGRLTQSALLRTT